MNSKRFFVAATVAAFAACPAIGACGSASDNIGETHPASPPTVPPSAGPAPVTPPPPETVLAPIEEPLQVSLDSASPPSGAVAGGTAKILAIFRVTNPGKSAVSVGSFTLAALGEKFSLKDYEGVEYRWSLPPSPKGAKPLGMDGRVVFQPGKGEIALPAGAAGQLIVVGRMAAQVAPNTAAGDLPKSGNTSSLGLVSLRSRSGLEADFVKPLAGAKHVLRKSFPMVTPVPMASEGLANGSLELYKFDLKAEAAAMGLKQFAFEVSISGAQLCGFRIQQAGKVPKDFYALGIPSDPKASVTDLTSGCLGEGNGQRIVVGFASEETVPQDVIVPFTLFAVAENVAPGAWTLTNFVQTKILTTDVLVCLGSGLTSFAENPSSIPAILWSDMSEVPHETTFQPSKCQSFKDWIGDGSLADFTLAQARKQ